MSCFRDAHVFSYKDSNDRLAELAGDKSGVAIFDRDSLLVSFDHNFSRLYCRESEHEIDAGASWTQILLNQNCRYPLVFAPPEKVTKTSQELLLGKGKWTRIYCWMREDNLLVTVHSDISEIKRKIRDRRFQMQNKLRLATAGARERTGINIARRVTKNRRASVGFDTIVELSDSGEESAIPTLSRSLPISFDETQFDSSSLSNHLASLAVTPIEPSSCPTNLWHKRFDRFLDDDQSSQDLNGSF